MPPPYEKASHVGSTLHRMRAPPAQATVRALRRADVTSHAKPRSQRTSAGSVYHARLQRDSIIEMRGSRYKAGMSWSEVELSTN